MSYTAGDVVAGILELDNPQGIHIKRVQCTIQQYLKVQGDGVSQTIVDMALPDMTNTMEKLLKRRFEIPIPADSLPTFIFNPTDYDEPSIRVEILYSIQFQVHVRGLLGDFGVIKELRIAIDPWKHGNNGAISLIDRA